MIIIFSLQLLLHNTMAEEVKLVIGQTLDGDNQDYYICMNSLLGQGAFGKVRLAYSAKDKARKLAAKIIRFQGDLKRREAIEKQLQIISALPPHPNLVRVHPIKCFNDNNFYIFMDYCQDGTLQPLKDNPSLLPEDKLINIFYQLIRGYEQLWRKGILHHDLKLANILIRKGTLKIADFGFAIFGEKYIPSLTRPGTLQYMPFQKMTSVQYKPDEKTDIYSLGVMMFELITKKHPYVNTRLISKEPQEKRDQYVTLLRKAAMIQSPLIYTYSAALQGLFDVVARMVAKVAKNRPLFQEILDYLQHDQIFARYREQDVEKTEEIFLNPVPMIVIGESVTFVLPIQVQTKEQKRYIEEIKRTVEMKKNEQERKIITDIEQWVLSLRLSVYYFDRLARRLFVQKLRSPFFSKHKVNSYNKTVLSCLLLAYKLTKYILEQIKTPTELSAAQGKLFRQSEEGERSYRIIRRDECYISDQINDNVKRTIQAQQQQLKRLVDLAQTASFKKFVDTIRPHLKQCLEFKANCLQNAKDVITAHYLIDSLVRLDTLPKVPEGLLLEQYFHRVEMLKDCRKLVAQIETYCDENDIDVIIDSALREQSSEELPLEEQQSLLKQH